MRPFFSFANSFLRVAAVPYAKLFPRHNVAENFGTGWLSVCKKRLFGAKSAFPVANFCASIGWNSHFVRRMMNVLSFICSKFALVCVVTVQKYRKELQDEL